MSRVKFDVQAFERSRKRKSVLDVYCLGIKEEMQILDIKYFPEGILKGFSEAESTMVVAASKNGLFPPKVYTGDGRMIIEDATIWKPDWDSDEKSEHINCRSFEDIIDEFSNWSNRKNHKENTDVFNLMFDDNIICETELKANDRSWIYDGIKSEVVVLENMKISAYEIYNYIKKLLSETYLDESSDEYNNLLDKKREAYYEVLEFFKYYDNYINSNEEKYIKNKSANEVLEFFKNKSAIVDYNTISKIVGKGEYEPNPVMIAADGTVCEGVRPEHKYYQEEIKSEDKSKKCYKNIVDDLVSELSDKKFAKARVTVDVDGNNNVREVITDSKFVEPDPKRSEDGCICTPVSPSVRFSMNDVTVG